MAMNYEQLGRKIEDMPTSLNYEVESVKDVRGVTDTSATVGTVTTEVNPVILNKDSALATFLDTAIEREYELTQLEKTFVVVRMFKKIGADFATGKYAAYRQAAIVQPGDYAMTNKELQMSATLHWTGEKIHGTFDPATKLFTAETAPPAPSEIHYKDGDASRSEYHILYEFDAAAPAGFAGYSTPKTKGE